MAQWIGIEFPAWLLVIIALGLVLCVNRKRERERERADTRRGDAKLSTAEERLARASDAARDVAMHLGVGTGIARAERRLPVTIIVNDVVLRRGEDGEWTSIPDAVRVVVLLNEMASVFLIARVDSDEEEGHVRDLALAKGLVIPSVAGKAPDSTGIPEHRLLFCSSETGQLAFARQLRVSLHIGGSVQFLQELSRFVPCLVRIDPDAVECSTPDDFMALPTGGESQGRGQGQGQGVSSNVFDGDRLAWREFKSLAAAGGLSGRIDSSAVSSPAGGRSASAEGMGTKDQRVT